MLHVFDQFGTTRIITCNNKLLYNTNRWCVSLKTKLCIASGGYNGYVFKYPNA